MALPDEQGSRPRRKGDPRHHHRDTDSGPVSISKQRSAASDCAVTCEWTGEY
jgi:hypothetical protein